MGARRQTRGLLRGRGAGRSFERRTREILARGFGSRMGMIQMGSNRKREEERRGVALAVWVRA